MRPHSGQPSPAHHVQQVGTPPGYQPAASPSPFAQQRRVVPNRRARLPIPLTWIMVFGGVLAVALACAIGLLAVWSIRTSRDILPGVVLTGPWTGHIKIGGLSAGEAATVLDAVVIDRPITIKDGDRTWPFSSAQLGIRLDREATIQAAMLAGRINLTQGAFGRVPVTPVLTVDLAQASETLTALTAQVNVKPGTGSPTAPGRTLNVSATLDSIPADLDGLLRGGQLTLVVDTVEGPRTRHTVQRGEELGLIAKKYNVSVQDIISLNQIDDADLIYPGQELLIPAAGVYIPTGADAPPAPLSSGKAIVVKLSEQRIYAYENGQLVHSALVSTGRPGTETVRGDFKVYVKYESTRMRGPDYDLPNVPWTMYFFEGYGIHGAYWHNNFGRRMSHGCVNLDTSEAKWFFDFAPVGTPVRVID